MSTSLSDDAAAAYQRFRYQARMLGSISCSFDELAVGLNSAYLTALTRPTCDAWTILITRTALLVQLTHELSKIIVLDVKERAALDFFEAILRENIDLLAAPAASEVSSSFAFSRPFHLRSF